MVIRYLVLESTSESRAQTSKEDVMDSGDDGATKPVCDTTESGAETTKNEVIDEVDSATGPVHEEVSTINDIVVPKLIADPKESKLTADTKESSKGIKLIFLVYLRIVCEIPVKL